MNNTTTQTETAPKMTLNAMIAYRTAAKGTNVIKMRIKATGATVLASEIESKGRKLFFAAVITSRGRVESGYASSAANREAWVISKLKGLAAWNDRVTARRIARTSHVTALKVGDILVSSWGYDQTNIDFYQVTKVIGRQTVELCGIASKHVETTGHMSERVTADPGNFKGNPFRAKATEHDSVRVSDSANAYPWDGQPRTETSYH